RARLERVRLEDTVRVALTVDGRPADGLVAVRPDAHAPPAGVAAGGRTGLDLDLDPAARRRLGGPRRDQLREGKAGRLPRRRPAACCAAAQDEAVGGRLSEPDVVEIRGRPAGRRVLDRRGNARADAPGRCGAVGAQDGDLPVHARILHPCRALDEGPDIEAIEPGAVRGLDRELEPRDLAGTDVVARLRRDPVEARPSRLRRPELAIAAEDGRLILTRISVPGAEAG